MFDDDVHLQLKFFRTYLEPSFACVSHSDQQGLRLESIDWEADVGHTWPSSGELPAAIATQVSLVSGLFY